MSTTELYLFMIGIGWIPDGGCNCAGGKKMYFQKNDVRCTVYPEINQVAFSDGRSCLLEQLKEFIKKY